jgi:membrane dipeptidase
MSSATTRISNSIRFSDPGVYGTQHVGMERQAISTVPAGLEDVSRMPHLTAALLERGYSEQDVKKILSGNFLRIMRQVAGR